MLPRHARLTHATDFRRTVRGGVRAGRRTVVVHAAHSPARAGVRVGFVVSKAVGPAVTRNRVKRRLRHLAADQLTLTPAGTDLVVRALPSASGPGNTLPADLGGAWAQALATLAGRPVGTSA